MQFLAKISTSTQTVEGIRVVVLKLLAYRLSLSQQIIRHNEIDEEEIRHHRDMAKPPATAPPRSREIEDLRVKVSQLETKCRDREVRLSQSDLARQSLEKQLDNYHRRSYGANGESAAGDESVAVYAVQA